LDGTWNTADADHVTNIIQIRDLIDPKYTRQDGTTIKQRVYYEPGVGTWGTKFRRWIDGATGGGLEDNVRGAYRFLSNIYFSGLEIYIFGFSRGAFTARSLAGFIGASGLLRPEHCNAANERRAWEYYRTAPKYRFPAEGRKLRELSFDDVRIKLLGVFDTVGSRGIPITGIASWYNRRHYGFHDVSLGSNVDHALHALAIDEKRLSFPAAMWQYPNHKDNISVEQVWFAGNHSNVGGGYKDISLSSIALKWMITRITAKQLGLKFVDKWQDRISPDPMGRLDDETRSWKFFFSRLCPSYRIINQCPAKASGRRVGLPPHAIPIGEMLHWTVLHRRENKDGYRPPNLESALDAMLRGQKLMPIVGNSEQTLQWFEESKDLAQVMALLPSLADRFAMAAAGIRDADKPLDVREEAKLQAAKQV
jgi:hypothetical protein